MKACTSVCPLHPASNPVLTESFLIIANVQITNIVFPWSERLAQAQSGEPVKICDVGAGNGHVSLDLLRAYPDSDGRAPLHAYVQDVPATLDLAKLVRSFSLDRSDIRY